MDEHFATNEKVCRFESCQSYQFSRGGGTATQRPAKALHVSSNLTHESGGVCPAAWASVLKTDDTERYGDRHCHPSSNSWITNRSSGRHSLLKSRCLHGHGDQDLSYPPISFQEQIKRLNETSRAAAQVGFWSSL